MASLVKWLMYSGARTVAGEPVASGTIGFYVPGSTSEEVTVYADMAETEPLVQPVSLDAAGRAEVYLKVPAEVIVKDADGATVRLSENATTVDSAQVVASWGGSSSNLGTILSDLQLSLTGSATGSALYRESSSTGVAPRYYQDAVHRVIEPKDFGATGLGVADDVLPLQRAINRAIATKLPLYLGTGTYKVTAGLTINGALQIIGAGKDSCLIFMATEAADLFTVDAGSATAAVQMLDFSALVPYAAGSGYAAINITRCNKSLFDGLGLTSFYGITGHATNFKDSVVSRCSATIKGATSIGFNVGTRVRVIDCTATEDTSAAEGFRASGANCTFINCEAVSTTKGFVPEVATTAFVRCTATSCGTDVSGTATTYTSIANSWDVIGEVSAALVTADAGTVSRVLVMPSWVGGGVKLVSIYMTAIADTDADDVALTLTGAAAFTNVPTVVGMGGTLYDSGAMAAWSAAADGVHFGWLAPSGTMAGWITLMGD